MATKDQALAGPGDAGCVRSPGRMIHATNAAKAAMYRTGSRQSRKPLVATSPAVRRNSSSGREKRPCAGGLGHQPFSEARPPCPHGGANPRVVIREARAPEMLV